jgi:hypothetical protein
VTQRSEPAPDRRAANEYHGACHCGALTLCFCTALGSAEWFIRACQCSFCRLHGALTTSDPAGRLSFSTSGSDVLQRYRFGARTADFLICRFCGVYIGAAIDADGARFGLLNVRALRPMPPDLPRPLPMDYDGESLPARLARRVARWTPLSAKSL